MKNTSVDHSTSGSTSATSTSVTNSIAPAPTRATIDGGTCSTECKRESDDDDGEHRHRADQQPGVLDRASLLQRHHLVEVHVVAAQVGAEQHPGEHDEEREDHDDRRRHVDEEVVERQARPGCR